MTTVGTPEYIHARIKLIVSDPTKHAELKRQLTKMEGRTSDSCGKRLDKITQLFTNLPPLLATTPENQGKWFKHLQLGLHPDKLQNAGGGTPAMFKVLNRLFHIAHSCIQTHARWLPSYRRMSQQQKDKTYQSIMRFTSGVDHDAEVASLNSRREHFRTVVEAYKKHGPKGAARAASRAAEANRLRTWKTAMRLKNKQRREGFAVNLLTNKMEPITALVSVAAPAAAPRYRTVRGGYRRALVKAKPTAVAKRASYVSLMPTKDDYLTMVDSLLHWLPATAENMGIRAILETYKPGIAALARDFQMELPVPMAEVSAQARNLTTEFLDASGAGKNVPIYVTETPGWGMREMGPRIKGPTKKSAK